MGCSRVNGEVGVGTETSSRPGLRYQQAGKGRVHEWMSGLGLSIDTSTAARTLRQAVPRTDADRLEKVEYV